MKSLGAGIYLPQSTLILEHSECTSQQSLLCRSATMSEQPLSLVFGVYFISTKQTTKQIKQFYGLHLVES